MSRAGVRLDVQGKGLIGCPEQGLDWTCKVRV